MNEKKKQEIPMDFKLDDFFTSQEQRDENQKERIEEIDISLIDGMEDGEYTYYLKDGDELLATGLLQIGDYKRDENVNTEYNDNNNGYIVYDGK